jgi:hypothetical protein
MIPLAQLREDRDQQFADWGETVTFRRVTATFDPEPQHVTESHDDTSIAAIVGPLENTPTRGTAARTLEGDLKLLVKAEELPAGARNCTSRIVRGGVEYDVVSFALSTCGLVETLTCRRR